MLTCTKMIGFELNIYVSTGPNTAEYKKILAKEIDDQSLDFKIIEDISRSREVSKKGHA